jgi:hypothetical protein
MRQKAPKDINDWPNYRLILGDGSSGKEGSVFWPNLEIQKRTISLEMRMNSMRRHFLASRKKTLPQTI